jgi:phospholipase/carboxylesterase
MMELLDCVELKTAEAPVASVIWLHGLGADGWDFAPVVDELDTLGIPATRFVFPHAPMRPVTINGGIVMRAWYDILDTEEPHREDEAGIRGSQTQVEALIEREVERGVPRLRIVLAGFSQGSAIALHTGLRQAEPLAGVIGLSGYLPLAESFAAERAMQSAAVPVFMAHGTHDSVVAVGRGRASRDRLQVLGYAVQWHEYPMQHAVCADEIRHVAQFLNAALGSA